MGNNASDQRVFLNQTEELGKFVQLMVRRDTLYVPYFVSVNVDKLHATGVTFLLDKFDVPYKFRIDRSNDNAKVPEKKGEGYEVVGGGKMQYYKIEKFVVINKASNSAGYWVGFNRHHFEEVRPYFPEGLEVELANER